MLDIHVRFGYGDVLIEFINLHELDYCCMICILLQQDSNSIGLILYCRYSRNLFSAILILLIDFHIRWRIRWGLPGLIGCNLSSGIFSCGNKQLLSPTSEANSPCWLLFVVFSPEVKGYQGKRNKKRKRKNRNRKNEN